MEISCLLWHSSSFLYDREGTAQIVFIPIAVDHSTQQNCITDYSKKVTVISNEVMLRKRNYCHKHRNPLPCAQYENNCMVRDKLFSKELQNVL
jgi:hypothetical protein